MTKRLMTTACLALALGALACSPKIYLADRQTVLEDEAAGEWPDFDRDILRSAQASMPTPYPTTAASARKKRLFNVLNGEVTSSRSPEARAAASASMVSKAPGALNASQ